MNLNSVSSAPAKPFTVSRGTVLVGLTITTAFNGFFDSAADSPWLSPFLDHTILWVCLGIAACHLVRDRRPVRNRDLVVAMPALIGATALSPMVVWLGLAVTLCCFLLYSSDRQVCIGLRIGLAVALHEPVIEFIGYAAGDHLLNFDQAVMTAVSSLLLFATDILGKTATQSRPELVLVWGCSSLNNVSLAVLLWSVVTYTVAPEAPLRIWLFGLLLGLLVVAINIVRLAVMGIDLEIYRAIHEDRTGGAFRILVLISIFAITAITRRYALRLDLQRR